MRYANVVGPNPIEPSYAKTFATRYGPPSGVRTWCSDLLMSYVVPIPKMVYFFEAAFENGLYFPLHPFIKSVLQHSVYVRPNSLPIFRASWSAFWFFLGIRASGSLV